MTSITARQHLTDEAPTSTERTSINGSDELATSRSWPIDPVTMQSREQGLLLG
jgi:hypothetical protein